MNVLSAYLTWSNAFIGAFLICLCILAAIIGIDTYRNRRNQRDD